MGYLYFIKVQSVTSSLPAITLTETLPAITSFSTIFQTVAVDADTVTQTSIEVNYSHYNNNLSSILISIMVNEGSKDN